MSQALAESCFKVKDLLFFFPFFLLVFIFIFHPSLCFSGLHMQSSAACRRGHSGEINRTTAHRWLRLSAVTPAGWQPNLAPAITQSAPSSTEPCLLGMYLPSRHGYRNSEPTDVMSLQSERARPTTLTGRRRPVKKDKRQGQGQGLRRGSGSTRPFPSRPSLNCGHKLWTLFRLPPPPPSQPSTRPHVH